MAGYGSRFSRAGYLDPKPLIPVDGVPMIQLVIENLSPRCPHQFIFICQQEHLIKHGLKDVLVKAAPGCEIIGINELTEGAACTCLLAKDLINNEDGLLIANCDQYIETDINTFIKAIDNTLSDGLIMTMKAHDKKWSFIKINDQHQVTLVVEKEKISDEATVGIYHFRHGKDFVNSAEKMIAKNLRVNGEFYVAPLYNEMIQTGKVISFYNIGAVEKDMHGLGTPEDLKQFLALIKVGKLKFSNR
jgi:dTDP-glucose pyrophosphorylase